MKKDNYAQKHAIIINTSLLEKEYIIQNEKLEEISVFGNLIQNKLYDLNKLIRFDYFMSDMYYPYVDKNTNFIENAKK